MDLEQESDLTKRAREVLAGLTETMRRDILRVAELSEGIALRTGRALRRRDVVGVYAGRLGLWKLTDLGREVARLITEANRG